MLGGLQTGKFDAIMAVPAWIFRAEDDGYGKTIYDITDGDSWSRVFGGDIPATVVYVLEDTAAGNPDLTQSYVNAIYKSMQWLGESSVDEIQGVVGEMMPRFAPEDVRREVEYYKKIWRYDGTFPKSDYQNGAKVWFREKTKIAPLDYGEVVDTSFLANAQKA